MRLWSETRLDREGMHTLCLPWETTHKEGGKSVSVMAEDAFPDRRRGIEQEMPRPRS